MNMFKKNGGFTLVELIVVIAILAILAGVAIPAYSGYIEKAKDAAVITELDAIQTAAQAANATAGEVTTISIASTGVVTITANPTTLATNFGADFKLFYNNCTVNGNAVTITDFAKLVEGTSYANKTVEWNSGKWTTK